MDIAAVKKTILTTKRLAGISWRELADAAKMDETHLMRAIKDPTKPIINWFAFSSVCIKLNLSIDELITGKRTIVLPVDFGQSEAVLLRNTVRAVSEYKNSGV